MDVDRRIEHRALRAHSDVVAEWEGAGRGGGNSGVTNSAELYDPVTGMWTLTGAMTTERVDQTATLLPNGKVLVAGGYSGSNATNSAELYDLTTGTWTLTGALNTARYWHTATLLTSGKVLVVGGYGNSGITYSAELYDPANETWALTGL